MGRYVVVDVGCLECGHPSDLVGVYTTRAEALATGAIPQAVLDDGDWSGSRLRVMFEADG